MRKRDTLENLHKLYEYYKKQKEQEKKTESGLFGFSKTKQKPYFFAKKRKFNLIKFRKTKIFFFFI